MFGYSRLLARKQRKESNSGFLTLTEQQYVSWKMYLCKPPSQCLNLKPILLKLSTLPHDPQPNLWRIYICTLGRCPRVCTTQIFWFTFCWYHGWICRSKLGSPNCKTQPLNIFLPFLHWCLEFTIKKDIWGETFWVKKEFTQCAPRGVRKKSNRLFQTCVEWKRTPLFIFGINEVWRKSWFSRIWGQENNRWLYSPSRSFWKVNLTFPRPPK